MAFSAREATILTREMWAHLEAISVVSSFDDGCLYVVWRGARRLFGCGRDEKPGSLESVTSIVAATIVACGLIVGVVALVVWVVVQWATR